ncbi:SusD/RagB family nutrient-binding outer membrane lipoprotein [Bacteroides sp. L10-4]|nr:SusD/RagB family nutrient-binding outer membrane lipoprotein [Bacteroides sp. L10-4]
MLGGIYRAYAASGTFVRHLNFSGRLKTENVERYAAVVEALGRDGNAGTRLWWDTGIN